MTIEWLAGNRLKGTSSERTTTSGFSPISAISAGWKQIGRNTLNSGTATSIDVTGLTDKRYYMVLYSMIDDGTNTQFVTNQFGNGSFDTNGNYAERGVSNGGSTDFEYGGQSYWNTSGGDQVCPEFTVQHIANKSGQPKLGISHSCGAQADGASTAPNRRQHVGKWSENNVIDRIRATTAYGSRTYGTGSEVIVLGYDPDDTHTDNFFEQLYSDSQTGQSTNNIDTGTFTNKKFLWVQLWCKGTGNTTVKMTFNNSTDSTYAFRWSNDGESGGADPTPATSSSNIVLHNTKANDDKFINMFIVNDGTNEILGMAHTVEGNNDDAGVAPQRRDTAFKRSTATAITDIEFDNDDSGSFTDWKLKVWGAN